MKMVVFDMDSTLIDAETIDELAAIAGVGDQVAEITRQAMNGELDYGEALRRRVSLLKGLSIERANAVVDRLPLILPQPQKAPVRPVGHPAMGHNVKDDSC